MRYRESGQPYWGIVSGSEVRPVADGHQSTAALLEKPLDEWIKQASGVRGSEIHRVTPLSPITQPSRIYCQGVNYSTHRREAGLDPQRPALNTFFAKADSSLSGALDPVIKPPQVELLDYEIELGLLLRGPVREPVSVTLSNLTDYVAGLFIANDISARDIQIPPGQWFLGKSFRTFCPAGPILYLLEPDEASLVYELELRLWVNDEIRQSASTAQLIFGPEETLTELSSVANWDTGDVLLTGTPGGVALNLTAEVWSVLANPQLDGGEKQRRLRQAESENPRYLHEGDQVRAEIRHVDGTLSLGTQNFMVVSP